MDLELDTVPCSRDDLALLVGAAKAVLVNARPPGTVEGRLHMATLRGAIERGETALGIPIALGSERNGPNRPARRDQKFGRG